MKSQLAKYQLDNMTLLDIMMNTLSAAEKLIFRNFEGKKYAYYDEGNSASWKNTNQLVRELQIQKECLQSMMHLYHKNSNNQKFEFPQNLTKEQIIHDLIILRDESSKFYNYNVTSIYNDIIKIINCEPCNHYTVEQIYSNDKNHSVPMDEESAKNNAKKIIEARDKMIEKDSANEKEIIKNGGKTFYQAVLNYNTRNNIKNEYYKYLYQSFK
jgi:hypothetical protein